MANYGYWIKLYTEILTDGKMGVLPDRLWRRFIELLCIAGQMHKDGALPNTEQITWALNRRGQESEIEQDLLELAERKFIKRTKTGWIVINFAKRQAPADEKTRHDEFMKRNPGYRSPSQIAKKAQKQGQNERQKDNETLNKNNETLHLFNENLTDQIRIDIEQNRKDKSQAEVVIASEEGEPGHQVHPSPGSNGHLSIEKAWRLTIDQLKEIQGTHRAVDYLSRSQVQDVTDGVLTIQAPNPDARAWLEGRMTAALERSLSGACNQDMRVRFV